MLSEYFTNKKKNYLRIKGLLNEARPIFPARQDLWNFILPVQTEKSLHVLKGDFWQLQVTFDPVYLVCFDNVVSGCMQNCTHEHK